MVFWDELQRGVQADSSCEVFQQSVCYLIGTHFKSEDFLHVGLKNAASMLCDRTVHSPDLRRDLLNELPVFFCIEFSRGQFFVTHEALGRLRSE